MRWQRWREFLGRLSRRQYLAVHLLVGLLLSVLLVFVFAQIARRVSGDDPLTQFDTALGLRLAELRREAPALRVLMMAVTLVGAFEFMLVFVPLVGVILWVGRRRLLAVVWVVAGLGGGLLNQALKRFYDRPRPFFKDSWVYESNQSFPSGHSTGALVVFGLLAYLLALACPRRRLLIVGGLGLLILTIGFSRIFLGAHYFSDVMGGFCVGAAWLTVCITAIQSVRLRTGQQGENKGA
jgi:undecaprenyl-diphosphatase